MPSELKPLFRPEVLRPKLRTFPLPPSVDAGRPKLANWARLLASPRAEKLKETELLGDFIRDVFGELLGYTGPAGGADAYTMKREATVQVDGKFADAAFGRFSTANDETRFVAVLEGKGPRDPLDRPFGRTLSAIDQALRYAVNLPCDWYLVTNLRETRLYHKGHDQFTCERFETAILATDDAALRKFVFLLGAARVLPTPGTCHLDLLLADSKRIGVELTRDYYLEYADLRRRTFAELQKNNPAIAPAALLTATQKILDRILFIAFSEDRGLLPRESIAKAYRHADPYNPRPIWDNFRGLFRSVDIGNPPLGIEKYNGGLFAPDELLERLAVPDAVCKWLDKLAAYDYGSPADIEGETKDGPVKLIDVEILGHIFEQSISDLEELHKAIGSDAPAEPVKAGPSKRKKEGAFYTPSFVTRYIVAQTLGPALAERFEALRVQHEQEAPAAHRALLKNPNAYDIAELKAGGKSALVKFWEAWQDALATVRIVDPACGSGAFLIEAFEQLYRHYRQSLDRLEELRGKVLFDIDRQILQQNLFGVDLNEEAVEICRLGLWIKTAVPGKELTSLDHNIRVGNSIVADPAVHPQALDWQAAFPEVFAAGGFDVVIGNPPYVRQEWISPYKPYLQEHYKAYDGVADLYVYFYELGVNVLKPGGRLAFIVTNKWMRAGYGEPLRQFFSESAWIDSVVDFGHAKQFFPDADVFPSILVVRKPTSHTPPTTSRVCAIPREQVRIDDLSRQIEAQGVEVPRSRFSKDLWSLEPPGVARLMAKIQKVGLALKDYLGSGPYRGVTTGFNDAFCVDSATRAELIRQDRNCETLIKPFVRGQDVTRWSPDWPGSWLIFARRGIAIEQFPSIHKHLQQFREKLEPKPAHWAGKEWAGRKPGAYKWYEIQDTTEYWPEFEKPKLIYGEITWSSAWSLDTKGLYSTNTVYFIPKPDLWVLAVANAPLTWWYAWRAAVHGKDEALRFIGAFVETMPIPPPALGETDKAEGAVKRLAELAMGNHAGVRAFLDWLRVEFEVEKATQKLQALTNLDADGLVAEVKKARGKNKPLTVVGLKALREEHARSVMPLQGLAAEARGLEQTLSDLVNRAYGLTPEEVALMWKTAPPRMPIAGPVG